MRPGLLPSPLPTCSFPAPPVTTINWDVQSWARWVARHCQCYGHRMLRKLLREEGRVW